MKYAKFKNVSEVMHITMPGWRSSDDTPVRRVVIVAEYADENYNEGLAELNECISQLGEVIAYQEFES